MLYRFTAAVKAPGRKYTLKHSGSIEAASEIAAIVTARLQTSMEMNVPDVSIKKLTLKAVQ